MNISCIGLAGGKSKRLGRNKLTEIIGGKTTLERVLDTLEQFNSEIILVTASHSSLPPVNRYPRVKIVNDVYPGTGSLGGIYTGLHNSKTFYNLVVACDMPFLNLDLLRYMLDISEGFDLVTFSQIGRPEPLHAVYSKNCLIPMKSLIEKKSLRIIDIVPFIKVRYITKKEIDRLDPQHLSFFNINTEEELERARKIAGNLTL